MDEVEQLRCGDESAHFEEVVAVEFAIAWGAERPAVEESSVLVEEEKADVPKEEREEEDIEEIPVPSFALDASAEDERTPDSSASLDLAAEHINRPPTTRLHPHQLPKWTAKSSSTRRPPRTRPTTRISWCRQSGLQKSNEEPLRIGDAVVVKGPIAPVLGEGVEEAKWEGRGMYESALPGKY